MVGKKTKASITFDVVNYGLLALFAVICILPILYVISASLTTQEELLRKTIVLIPTQITFSAYKYILSTNTLMHSVLNSIVITLVGTAINILATSLTAYPLSKPYFRGRKIVMMLVVFTMLFNGGMIPSYLLVTGLGIGNTFWSLWLPGAISAYYLILLKNFFQQLPAEIEEAAEIDGCNEWQILFKIVLPLSLPAIATFSLFYAVGHWNAYFNALLYISNSDKWPVTVWLRQIVLLSTGGFSDSTSVSDAAKSVPPQSVSYAVIVVATIPVLLIYPFLQKYFAKGALVGSVKG